MTPPVLPAPARNLLTISHGINAGEAILILCGELDVASARTLEAELRYVESTHPERIVLNLAALDFIDSTGIHLLMHAQRRAEASGHELVLTHVAPDAARLFRLTKIDTRVTIE